MEDPMDISIASIWSQINFYLVMGMVRHVIIVSFLSLDMLLTSV